MRVNARVVRARVRACVRVQLGARVNALRSEIDSFRAELEEQVCVCVRARVCIRTCVRECARGCVSVRARVHALCVCGLCVCARVRLCVRVCARRTHVRVC